MMAEYRTVHAKLWSDAWFTELEPDAKLLYIYLFTNPDASVSGIYERPAKFLAFDTGLTLTRVKSLLTSFERAGKIRWQDPLIWVVKMRDYQATTSPKVVTRIRKDLDAIRPCSIKTEYLAKYERREAIPYPKPQIPYPETKRETETETDTDTETDTETETETETASSSSPSSASTEDDPTVERLQKHEIPYATAITLAAGKDALAIAWMDYADQSPGIPNVPAFLIKNIKAGRMPPKPGGSRVRAGQSRPGPKPNEPDFSAYAAKYNGLPGPDLSSLPSVRGVGIRPP